MTAPSEAMKIVVAQMGARRHYAIPRMLHNAGLLSRFYTDACAVKGLPRLLALTPTSLRPAALRRLLGRVPTGVPGNLITAFTGLGVRLTSRLARAADQNHASRILVEESSAFCEKVLRRGLGDANAVYTFNGAGLELLRAGKQKGLFTIMEMTIAPRRYELELMNHEHTRHPSWEDAPAPNAAMSAFMKREESEWDFADLILCGSDFVREGIRACGGPVERCVVVPYGLDGSKFRRDLKKGAVTGKPLRVLTVGAVGLRKGTPYVIEAARQLGRDAEFRLVGDRGFLARGGLDLPPNVQLTGVVPRAEVSEHFKWADVFLLPSVCEGSAMVTYEALATGLPVICTPNTGSVVTDNVDGLVVPVGSSQAIVESLKQLHQDRTALAEMSRKARDRGLTLTLANYEVNLLKSLNFAFNMNAGL